MSTEESTENCAIVTDTQFAAPTGLLHAIPLRAMFSASSSGAIGLTERVLNGLWREDITTVGDLVQCSRQDLADIRNFGTKCIDLVVRVLAEHGLSLAPDETLPRMSLDERDALRQALAGNGENLSIRLLILDDRRLERLHQAAVMLAAAAADVLNRRHS